METTINTSDVAATQQQRQSRQLTNSDIAMDAHQVGEFLVYSSDADGAYDLFVRTGDGSPAVCVARSSNSFNGHPRFSPDGRSLAFVSTRGGDRAAGTAVWLIEDVRACVRSGGLSRGGGGGGDKNENALCTPVVLTAPEFSDMSPSWAPSGAKIAVATGLGAAGTTGTTILHLAPGGKVMNREVVTQNGGWPAWLNETVVLFHRPGETIASTWSVYRATRGSSTSSWSHAVFIEDALTPYAAGGFVAYATIDASSYRQIMLLHVATGRSWPVTTGTTHHYNPTLVLGAEGTTVSILFHRCRGTSFPVLRQRRGPSASYPFDIAFVVGDFSAISPANADGRVLLTTVSPGLNAPRGANMFLNINAVDAVHGTLDPIWRGEAWQTSFDHSGRAGNGTIRLAFTRGPAFSAVNDTSVQVAVLELHAANFTPVAGSPKTITNLSANTGYPAFSHDGNYLVFRTASPCTAPGAVESNGDGDATLAPVFPGHYKGPYHLAKILANGTGPVITVTCPKLGGDDGVFFIGDQHPHVTRDGRLVWSSDRGHPQRMTIWMADDISGTSPREIFDGGAMSVHPSSYIAQDGRLHVVFTSTLAGSTMEEIAAPFGFVFDAELFDAPLDGVLGKPVRLTHDWGENANVYVSPHTLPKAAMRARASASAFCPDCRFHDSVQPIEPFRGKKGASACPHIGLRSGRVRTSLPGAFLHNNVTTNMNSLNLSPRPFAHGHVDSAEWRDHDDNVIKQAKMAGCPFFARK